MAPPNPIEVRKVQEALKAARTGGATLNQLSEAHAYAEKMGVPFATAELRKHMRAMLPDLESSRLSTSRGVCLGIISGIITHIILNFTDRSAAVRKLTFRENRRVHG